MLIFENNFKKKAGISANQARSAHSKVSIVGVHIFFYLTPDRVSDHLFRPHGNRTTSAPNNTTA